MPINLPVSYTAAIVGISCAVLSIYFNWQKQERNADLSYLCMYPATIVFFLLNGSPVIFKIFYIVPGAIAFALGLYRLPKPS